MARPRSPSNILEMKGAFHKDPKRRRVDSKGAAEFDKQPPSHMPPEHVRAWHFLVARLPLIAFYNCDEIAVEVTAGLLTNWWTTGSLNAAKELRLWLGKLGMTPGDRTRLEAEGPDDEEKDPAAKYLG